MYNFQWKRALVTGAGRGLGKDVAKALWSAGATTYALSKTKDNLDKLVAECPGIIPVCADVTNWEAVQKAVESILPVDLLVNNAGQWADASLLDITESEYDRIMGVNIKGMTAVSQVVARNMIKRKCHGVIVNVSSMLSHTGIECALAYQVSKGAVDSLTRSMVVQLGPHQIRVNSVHPTVFMTDLTKNTWPTEESLQTLTRRTPMRRIVDTRECTDAIMFLLSDKSSGIHGVMIPIDGGLWQSAAGRTWPKRLTGVDA